MLDGVSAVVFVPTLTRKHSEYTTGTLNSWDSNLKANSSNAQCVSTCRVRRHDTCGPSVSYPCGQPKAAPKVVARLPQSVSTYRGRCRVTCGPSVRYPINEPRAVAPVAARLQPEA